MSAADRAARIDLMRAMVPRNAKVKGGRVDGDRAFIDFIGSSETGALSGKAEMRLVDGHWIVKAIRSKS